MRASIATERVDSCRAVPTDQYLSRPVLVRERGPTGQCTCTQGSYAPTSWSAICAAGVTPPITKPKQRGPAWPGMRPGTMSSRRCVVVAVPTRQRARLGRRERGDGPSNPLPWVGNSLSLFRNPRSIASFVACAGREARSSMRWERCSWTRASWVRWVGRSDARGRVSEGSGECERTHRMRFVRIRCQRERERAGPFVVQSSERASAEAEQDSGTSGAKEGGLP